MSDRIKEYWHHLQVLSVSDQLLFDCIVSYSDKELTICIGELFLNLGNLHLKISDEDLEFLEQNVEGVEDLAWIGSKKGRHEEQLSIIRGHFGLVKRGVQIALDSLTASGFLQQ